MTKKNSFTFRFGVGDPKGRHSGVWRVWSNYGKSDIYIAIRTIAGDVKFSFHPTGECNFSLTSQSATNRPDLFIQNGGSRHIDQWIRQLNSGLELSIPLRIRFLDGELRQDVNDDTFADGISWLSAPPEGCSLDVICIFTNQLSGGERPVDWPWNSVIASADLPNGETFWLATHSYMTPPSVQALIEQQRLRAGLSAGSRLLIGETGPASVRIVTDAASISVDPI